MQNVSESWHDVNHSTCKLTATVTAQDNPSALKGGFVLLLTHVLVRAEAFLSKRKGGLTFCIQCCILACLLSGDEHCSDFKGFSLGKPDGFLCHAITLGVKGREKT